MSAKHEDDRVSDQDFDDTLVDCLLPEPVCHKCEETVSNRSQLIICSGGCFRRFHRDCVNSHIKQEKFTCFVCQLGGNWCFSCKARIEPDTPFEICDISFCKNRFHAHCIANLSEKCSRRFICAHHYCLTCSIEDRNPTSGSFLACIECPNAYHKNDKCIPAGTIMLNTRWIICTEHNKQGVKKTNVNFCFVCGLGGTLLCCESCPCAVHLECYGLEKAPDGHFICSSCQSGKKPLYGDIVWAKFGVHRWWPAEVMHPLKVPGNLEKYLGDPGIFIVRFFGTLDYGPVTRRSVYPFQVDDDDNDEKAKFKRTEKDKKYINAVLEARRALLDKQLTQLADLPTYTPIEVSKYAANVSKAYCTVQRDAEPSVCSCSKFSKSPCCDDDCENRQIFIECHPKYCWTEGLCRNQRFVKKQYAPAVKFMTIDRGFGLRALAPIKKGDFVIEYIGEIINREECNKRLTSLDAEPDRAFYFLELAPDKIIDAGPMGNDSRFINHSCDPNCKTERWIVNNEYRIGLFAKRDISPGEELTFHYNLDSLNHDFKTPCKCGSTNCTGFIGRIGSNKSNGKINNGNDNATQRKRKLP